MLIANILGVFLFLYLFWKRLKDDYLSEKIFNSEIILLSGISLALLISRFFLSNYWFWFVILSIFISEFIISVKVKLKFFESLDAIVISLIPWLSTYYLSGSISNSSLHMFIAFWICLLLIFLFFLFDYYYKSFSWYKSGKIGFSSLAVITIFFFLRSVLIINFESYISGAIALTSFLLLYKLSKADDD